jgi:hypothetical protein
MVATRGLAPWVDSCRNAVKDLETTNKLGELLSKPYISN